MSEQQLTELSEKLGQLAEAMRVSHEGLSTRLETAQTQLSARLDTAEAAQVEIRQSHATQMAAITEALSRLGGGGPSGGFNPAARPFLPGSAGSFEFLPASVGGAAPAQAGGSSSADQGPKSGLFEGFHHKMMGKPAVYDGDPKHWQKWKKRFRAYCQMENENFYNWLLHAGGHPDPLPNVCLDQGQVTFSRRLYASLLQMVEGKAFQIVDFEPEGNGLEAWRKLHLEY